MCAVLAKDHLQPNQLCAQTEAGFWIENTNLYVEFYSAIRYGDFQLRREVVLDACQTF